MIGEEVAVGVGSRTSGARAIGAGAELGADSGADLNAGLDTDLAERGPLAADARPCRCGIPGGRYGWRQYRLAGWFHVRFANRSTVQTMI
jgi:hypothetical protein